MHTKFSIVLVMVICYSLPNFAQDGNLFWTKTSHRQESKNQLNLGNIIPSKANFYTLDIAGLNQLLQAVPNRKIFKGQSQIVVQFPNNKGEMESFRIKEASIMEGKLQQQFPNMRSYIGESIDNPFNVIRFSITPGGIRTMTLTEEGAFFIDPFADNDYTYVAYLKSNLAYNKKEWVCNYLDNAENETNEIIIPNTSRTANDGVLREFRLALACTVEYAAFHGGTLPGAMAAMVNTMTRVNGIYERELSLTMVMVDNTSIVFLGPDVNSDPYSNNNGFAMLSENQTTIDANIGVSNYDIGHVFSTNGGGIASLNSPCTSDKARGVTGLTNPIGDAFDVDYVSHEMGHQFGGTHTFNGNAPGSGCLTQRTAFGAYEPGSGSTIMAYAGICAPQNVQNNSDDYFHQKSLDQIFSNLTFGNSRCANQIPIPNSAPTADAGGDFIIPASTPYRLTGAATDDGGQANLTYTWEQYDLGPTGAPTETTLEGPIVRSFKGTNNPTRYIPRLSDLLISRGSTNWEKLASINRNLNFRLTVRDNNPSGGQSAVSAMLAVVNASAGPFMVTSQDTDQIVWTPGSAETITWDVAGTTANNINAASVNILLSTSQNPNAENFDIVLASNVPNTGTFDITVPNLSSPFCRIMVEAVDNIFFNINDSYFAIGNYTYDSTEICKEYLFEPNLVLPENDQGLPSFVFNITDSKIISDLNISVDVTTTNNAELTMAVRGPFGDQTNLNFLQEGANNGCPGLADALVTFDDEGILNACNSTNSNLSIQPLETLAFANGQNSQGDWIFTIGDVVVDNNRATWNSLTFTICETGVFPVLSENDFSLDNTLTVFPNPNKGAFNIKFIAKPDNVKVNIFDIRGRSVFKTTYSNTAYQFEETINLESVTPGLYLLHITNGDNAVTKKVIIK